MKTLSASKILGISVGIILASLHANTASAATPWGQSNAVNNTYLFYDFVYLTAGRTYTFKTSNLSAYADTFLRVINSSGFEVAANDDCPPANCAGQSPVSSYLKYTPPVTGTYQVLVANYQSGISGATATVQVWDPTNTNPIVNFINLPIGGSYVSLPTWPAMANANHYGSMFAFVNNVRNDLSTTAPGEAFSDDTLMYLLKDSAAVSAWSDDEGSGLSSAIRDSTGCTSNCQVLVGANVWGGQAAGAARVQTWFGGYGDDSDYDNIPDVMENVIGTNRLLTDSDADGISDYIELVGIGSQDLPWMGALATQKDTFIQVSDMYTDSSLTTTFFGSHEAVVRSNMQSAFTQYGSSARIHLERTNVVSGFFPYVSDDASVPADTATFTYLQNAGYLNPDRLGIFHWILAGGRQRNGGTVTNSTGKNCERNRLVVTLGASGWHHVDNDYIGTTLHEMGHQLGLTHNGNGQDGGFYIAANSSLIHKSQMNYRYQLFPFSDGGLPWRFSIDAPSCVSTTVATPKNYCATGGFPDSGSCDCALVPHSSGCDCTFNEWQTMDYTGASIPTNNLGAGTSGGDSGLNELVRAAGIGLEVMPAADSSPDWDKDTVSNPQAYYAARLHSASERERTLKTPAVARALALARVAHAKERGWVEHLDFEVREDGSFVTLER